MAADLFDWMESASVEEVCASRADDPATSRIAEEEISADGSRERMMQVALEAVRAHPGLTANELERECGYTDGQIRKRLNDLWRLDLVRKGEVRRSSVSGKLNQTWYAVEGTS